MTRSQRQTIQLIAVGLLVILLVGWFVSTRASGANGVTAGPGSATAVAKTSGSSPSAARSAPSAPTVAAKPAVPQTDPASGLRFVAESALPKEGRETLALIRAGGPYPFPRNDDKTFSNAERLLPRQASGYYREYTVITPGSPDRGARRIVAGQGGELYYTSDHYASFQRIREGS